jgi:hypothetical protein
MIKIPKKNDYIVFDEHGLIFIYSNDNYTETLKNMDVEYKPKEKLIHEVDHWHYCLPSGREKLEELIKELKLQRE